MRHPIPVRLGLILVLAVFGGTGFAGAQGTFIGQSEHSHVKFMAPGLELDHASYDWTEVARLARSGPPDGAWAAFTAAMGPGWIVNRDAAFGTPSWIQGPGLDTGVTPLDEAAALEHARSLARRLAASLGIDDLGAMKVADVSTTPNQHDHRICGINFKQTVDGYDVRTLKGLQRVIFRYDLTIGRLSVVGSDWLPALAVKTTGAMSRDAAIERAKAMVPTYVPGTGRVLFFRTFVLVGADPEAGAPRARLVHEVQIQVEDPAHLWVVVLDARTGERLYIADGVCHTDVVGTVSLGGLDGGGGIPPAVPFSVKPARNLYVQVKGGTQATTDANGVFKITHGGTAVVTIQGRLYGDWCDVQNVGAGGVFGFSRSATPGTAANVVINGKHLNENRTAGATCYDWVNITHFMVKQRWPGWGTGSLTYLAKLPTKVNLSNNCNAYWNGSAIHFFTSGGGCNNSAIPEVVSHEWGHGFHYTWNSRSTSPGGFSEGIGDHMGLYTTRQRVMGRGFRTTGGVVRDYRVGGAANQTLWPTSGKPVHTAGQIWGGFCMDLRDYLITRHGSTKGVDIAETITIAQFARVPKEMDFGVRETMVQDDVDANLLNGTPNFHEIARAADRHKIPRPPDPKIIQYTHPRLTGTRDTVNAYPVSTKVISTDGTIVAAKLVYQVGSGSPTTVAMTRGAVADTWIASIPAQTAVKTVAYYLIATDSKNNTDNEPKHGAHVFAVGREVAVFSEDFEKPQAWTRGAGDTALAGRWQLANPIKAVTAGVRQNQPEDDTTPAPGVKCAVTQNGSIGQQGSVHDVDNGFTSFLSPVIDMLTVPTGGATIDFSYWFTNHLVNDDMLRLELSANGGTTWSTIWSTSVSSASWKAASGIPLPGAYTDKMRIKFVTYDTGSVSETDALIDDIVIRYADDNVAALRAQTRTPSIGTALDYSLSAPKEPRAAFLFVYSLALGSTPIPGIGTADLALPFFPLWSGTTSATGAASFKIPIPADASLKGLKVHTQSFVAGKAYVFSNVWTVDIQ